MELHLAAGNYYEAISLGKNILEIHDDNYLLQCFYLMHILKMNNSEKAEKILKELAKESQTDPNVWFKLAEAQGLIGKYA